MTDVRTWTEKFLRTTGDSDQDERSKFNTRDILHLGDEVFLHDSGSSSSPRSVRLKVRVMKGPKNGESSNLHDDNSEEGIFTCSLNEACICGDKMSDSFSEVNLSNKDSSSADLPRVVPDNDSLSNKDSSSADSQSVLADSEIDRLFAAAFLDSSNSSLSGSSSSSEEYFDESDLPFDFLSLEDIRAMHNDWDSGLSSNNNSHDDDEWSVAMSILGNFAQLENIRAGRHRGEHEEAPPLYPHRALMYHECQVCLTRSLLRRRVCCDFHICAECMTSYVSLKVNEAKVQIECPNDRCNVFIHRDEVNERLPKDMKDKFAKFLINANTDPCKKTCPACSEVYSVEPKMLSVKKKLLKHGIKVQCTQCNLYWCFLCQAPFHTEMTCKQYRKGDKMVKQWAKELSAGQSNAQKCPKCKIFIQKVNGCDHMKCSKCNTDFCYRCGDRYISMKLLGNHWSKFSLFGCKYRLLPKRPALRRLIRGANFAARVLAGVVLAGLGIAAGAILVGASVVIVPGYGLFRLRRHLQLKEKRKREKSWHPVDRFAERDAPRVFMLHTPGLAMNAQTEAEDQDAHQVQVMVHRSVSFSHEDAASEQNVQEDNYEFYINKYTTEGTDMVVSNIGDSNSDQVIMVTDVTEVQNGSGYPTVVAHIVSKMASDKEVTSKTKVSGKNKKGSNNNEPNVKLDLFEHSFGKTDHQVSFCDDDDHNDDDAVLKEMSLTESFLRKSMTSSADIPSCSWENLSGNGRVDSGYGGDYESNQDVNISEIKPGNLDSSSDPDGTKRGNNGCFGNIFSRRAQAPLASLEPPINVKTQMSNSRKKSLTQKAATWEKSHRDYMQSLLKSSPLDPVKDFNNLTFIMQKSPVSSVDLSDILNNEVKSLKTDFSSHRQESLSESFPSVDMSDVLSWCATSQDSLGTRTGSFVSENKDSSDDDDLIKYSSSTEPARYFHYDDCQISLCNEVTHL